MQTRKTVSEKIVPISITIIMGFIIILLRLWQLQIIHGNEFRNISESNRLRIIGVPAPRGIISDRNGIPLVKDSPFFVVSAIPQELDIKKLPELSKLLKMPEKDLFENLTSAGQNPSEPVRLKEGLSLAEVGFIEARHSDIPGIIIETDIGRKYLYSTSVAHLIGYLGKLTPEQSENPAFSDVPLHAFVGQWGIEKLLDKTLRGIAGQKYFEVDALGRQIRQFREIQPEKGKDITLTIDIAAQKAAEDAFRGRSGALVALEPDTGEILALVSSPSFDPNKFSQGIRREDWTALASDERHPMLNRAVQSQYPPGSTFKIITATAALEEHVIDEETAVNCRGSIKYGKSRFRCWKRWGHGRVSVHRALVESCDVFFYEVGKRLGIDNIYEYASRFGLGRKTGIPLGNEAKGLIPNSTWKLRTKKEKWFLGETFINAIGQGYVSATPVQMAVMISGIANGTTIYRPQILKNADPEPANRINVSPSTLKIVRDGLIGAVNESHGTGRSAKSDNITIAGKTGTAQVVSIYKKSSKLPYRLKDHAWFVAYAPAEKPAIALAVLVEHGGHGGSAAAPIAKKVIETYLLPEYSKREFLDVQN